MIYDLVVGADPPPYHPVGGRYRTPLDRLDQSRAMGRIQVSIGGEL